MNVTPNIGQNVPQTSYLYPPIVSSVPVPGYPTNPYASSLDMTNYMMQNQHQPHQQSSYFPMQQQQMQPSSQLPMNSTYGVRTSVPIYNAQNIVPSQQQFALTPNVPVSSTQNQFNAPLPSTSGLLPHSMPQVTTTKQIGEWGTQVNETVTSFINLKMPKNRLRCDGEVQNVVVQCKSDAWDKIQRENTQIKNMEMQCNVLANKYATKLQNMNKDDQSIEQLTNIRHELCKTRRASRQACERLVHTTVDVFKENNHNVLGAVSNEMPPPVNTSSYIGLTKKTSRSANGIPKMMVKEPTDTDCDTAVKNQINSITRINKPRQM